MLIPFVVTAAIVLITVALLALASDRRRRAFHRLPPDPKHGLVHKCKAWKNRQQASVVKGIATRTADFVEITRQPKGGKLAALGEVRLECEVKGEDVSFQWWQLNTSTHCIKSLVSNKGVCKTKLCGLVFCVISRPNHIPRVSDLVEIQGGTAYLPTWPAYTKEKEQCLPVAPSSPFDEQYMAQFETDGPAAPFFSSFTTHYTGNHTLSDSLYRYFSHLMKPGMQGRKDLLVEALGLLCSPSMLVHREFFVEDPEVAKQEAKSYSVEGQFYADFAVLGNLSPTLFYPLLFCDLNKGKNAIEKRVLNQVLRLYQSMRRSLAEEDDFAEIGLFARRGLFPCFLLTIVDKSAHLYGVATHWRGDQERISTSKLCSCSLEDDISEWRKLADTLKSGMQALEELWSSIKDGRADGLSPFPVVKPSPERFPSFEYTKAINSKVFEARNDEESLIVKFVTSPYPEEVHKHCYSNGVAPALRCVEQSGQYEMVVMEKVPEATSLDEYLQAAAAGGSENSGVVIDNLEKALHILHSGGYVHGDFRGSNILVCSDGAVKIIDFHWSCKEFQGEYKQLSNFYVWPCQENDELEKCHDLYFLAGYKRKSKTLLR